MNATLLRALEVKFARIALTLDLPAQFGVTK